MSKAISTLVFLCLTIFSCQNSPVDTPQPKEAIPPTSEVLDDKKIDLSSYRSRKDLIEELWQELLSHDAELKDLENAIEKNYQSALDAREEFQNFDQKSSNYYAAANAHVKYIKDTVLQKQIINLLAASSGAYASNTARFKDLIQSVDKNSATISDYDQVLKIVKTLLSIEQYQKEKMPDMQKLKDEEGRQNELMQKMKEHAKVH